MRFLSAPRVTLLMVFVEILMNDVLAFTIGGYIGFRKESKRTWPLAEPIVKPSSLVTNKQSVDGTTPSSSRAGSSIASLSPLFRAGSTLRRRQHQRRIRHAHVLPSPASSSSSSSSADLSLAAPGEDANKDNGTSFRNRFEWRLLRILLFPLTLLVMRPLRMLLELFIDTLDDDGTVAVVDGTDDADNISASNVNVAITGTPMSTALETVQPAIEVLPAMNDASTVVRAPRASSAARPVGERWAVAAPGVDLTGHWELIVDEEFRKQYDHYLAQLGQPLLVRSVALSIIGQTTEETVQTDHGRSLLIRGKNIRGIWDRTLVASGTDGLSKDKDDFVPLQIPIMSADSEQVQVESWWDHDGHVHVSWLKGVSKYGGGSFESRRYLQDDDKVYVCETVFYPNDKKKGPNPITWRFRPQGASS